MVANNTKTYSYMRGFWWSIAASALCAFNDFLMKKIGFNLSGGVTLFFRFFFSCIVFLPYILLRPGLFKTRHMWVHCIRGGLFALAMLPWSYGLIKIPLPIATIISFATPFFVTLLSVLWNKETMTMSRTLALITGFSGIVIGATCSGQWTSFNMIYLAIALGATFLFAVLDVLNKKMLTLNENVPSLIVHSAFWTSIFSLPFAARDWCTPTISDLAYLAVLGVSANALLGCLLKASQSVKDLSSLQPLRYSEFIFSCLFSIIFFNHYPNTSSLIGIAFIIPSAIYLMRKEKKSDT